MTSAKRSPLLPELPTIAQAGLPGYEQSAWHGLLAPAGTAQPLIDKLYADSTRVLKSPDTVQRMASQGVDVIAGSPAELAAHIRADVAKYAKLVKAAKITVD